LTSDSTAVTGTVAGPTSIPIKDVVKVKHYGRTAFAIFLILIVVAIAYYGFAKNPNIDWHVVWEFLFASSILEGLKTTVEITLIAMIFSVIGALIVALMRMSESLIIRLVAAGYIFIFRGIPIILLLIFVGNLGLFVRHVTLGIPFTHVIWYQRPAATLLTPFVASIIGLTLAGSAYMSEVVRAGLLSVGRGQHEAAKSLGLTSLQTTRFVVLPSALRVIIPPMGNELISMIKASAIVSVIGGGDLLTISQRISGANYRTIEMLIVAAFWYFTLIAVLSVGQHFLERRTAER